MTPDEYKDTDLPNSFLDGTLQICVVTHDLDKAVRAYADRLGIGPWWVQDAAAPAMADTKIRGVPTPFSMRLALAWTGAMNWEIIQPLEGPTVYKEFLEKHGEGVQHAAFSYSGLGFDRAVETFSTRGFAPIQECNWNGIRVCYFDTQGAALTTFEIWDWPEGMALPEPQYWYPAPEDR
jgi:hypothetical protein